MSEPWIVYILECNDSTYYTGITNDLDARLKKHNMGSGAKYTKGRGPVTLIWHMECENRSEAAKLEHQIKKLHRTAKEKLIEDMGH